ncbi:MAG TPA: hypothetical protein DCK76_05550 [Desulfotomaculum sp.]|nr:MAG: hypothetical protein XD84_1745 [Desulfotomaculum sp. 46_80]KUK84929.1 MAG: hypothetical protein XE00_0456 [Desulfofundulus kuznetsovii]HAG10840.1 hypothetical protein [Desulfotomaculum sp.]HBY04220.1 hypothetical protein [Desulfotomaculum sp.]
MYFPVSGVHVSPFVPPAVAFLISTLSTGAGISGAFLILPFMVSVLGYTSPAATPTNFICNLVAAPGGMVRFIKERRMNWPLTWVIVSGTIPGVFAGAWIRVVFLPDAKTFKLFMGIVLLGLGAYQLFTRKGRGKGVLEDKFLDRIKKQPGGKLVSGIPPGLTVKTVLVSFKRIDYDFWGETYSFNPLILFGIALAVGLVGGVYGISGAAIIAPVCVSVLKLPVYTIAGSTLTGNFLTSIAGIASYYFFFSSAKLQGNPAPDWLLGVLFGLGGFLGTYSGAYLQKFLPERLIITILGILVVILAVIYITGYFA